MGYKVILSTLALDLEQIVAYIAQNDAGAAERLGHRLLDQADTLRYLPHRGGNVRQRPGLKKLVSRGYLIFYRINEPARCVEILRFWHGAQDPDRLRLR
jgi:plasmid stabilization system protein ParE